MADDATVLVVDDEEEVAALYEAYLEAEYDVRVATSGAGALRAADDAVDVVLLDRRMPGMSGDEVLAELRERSIGAMVAMLTAVEPEGDIVDMPFDDYRVKPVDRSDVLGVVDTLLRRATYDEASQEFFSLASKKAALEVAGNDDTAEYARVAERLSAVREEVDDVLDEIEDEALFASLFEGEP